MSEALLQVRDMRTLLEDEQLRSEHQALVPGGFLRACFVKAAAGEECRDGDLRQLTGDVVVLVDAGDHEFIGALTRTSGAYAVNRGGQGMERTDELLVHGARSPQVDLARLRSARWDAQRRRKHGRQPVLVTPRRAPGAYSPVGYSAGAAAGCRRVVAPLRLCPDSRHTARHTAAG